MASAASLDEVCEHHSHAAGAAAARPLLPVRVFAGRHLSPGIAAACASAAKRWPSRPAGYPAAGDAKLGGERGQRAGSRVLAEIDREREAFAAQQASLRRAVQRYRRQLCRWCGCATTAHSAKFDGKATLPVAEKTRQEGMDPRSYGARGWGTGGVQPELRPRRYHLPQAFEAIGPVVRRFWGNG